MTFKIGDRVRLTGRCWNSHPGVSVGDIVTLSGCDRGDYYFFTGLGDKLFVLDFGMYEVELVTDEWTPAFTEVEETVKVKKSVDKPEIVPGDVLVVKTTTGELISYFTVRGTFNPVNLYGSNGHIADWDDIVKNAESYRFLFKDGKVV